MENFRTLNLAMSFYEECEKIKFKNYVLKNQFERAILSILLNLAEGAGRITENDKRKFYSIALGSLKEVQCLLLILKEHDKLKNSQHLNASLINLVKNPGSFKY